VTQPQLDIDAQVREGSLRPMAITAAGWADLSAKIRGAEAARLAGRDARAELAARPRLDVIGEPVAGTGGLLRTAGSVAVLTIDGALFRRASWITEVLELPTYDAIEAALDVVDRNDAIRAVLLRCNTPGGEADGCGAAADHVAAVAARKLVYTFNESLCASAGIWVGSQATRIVAHETAETGSIGVRWTLWDFSEAYAKIGIKQREIVSNLSPAKRSTPIDNEVEARIQTRADNLAEIFATAVARGRKVNVNTVVNDFGQGDVLIASDALAAGLIDEIGTLPGTLAALAAAATNTGSPSARARGARMSKQMDPSKPAASPAPTASMSDGKCDSCGKELSGSAKIYCKGCYDEPDGDEGGDEEAKASKGFRSQVFATLGVATAAEAIGKITAGAEALSEVPGLREQLAIAQTDGRRRDLRATLEAGIASKRLSLGRIQREMALVLRGATKAAWTEAMGKVKSVTAAGVIEAACSVAVSADDLEAIGEYAKHATVVVAQPYEEPARDAAAEAGELDETAQRVANAANRTRETMNRGRERAAKNKQ
jgi:ClpP class serine protease